MYLGVFDSTQPFFVLCFWNLTLLSSLFWQNTLSAGNTVSTDGARFLMEGALQLCCHKPKFEFLICILLMGRSDFASLFCEEVVRVCVSLLFPASVHMVCCLPKVVECVQTFVHVCSHSLYISVPVYATVSAGG